MRKSTEQNSFFRANLEINTLIAITLVLFSIVAFGSHMKKQLAKNKAQEEQAQLKEEQIKENFISSAITQIQNIQNQFDTTTWKKYQTNWYGFKIQYPKNWSQPTPRSAGKYTNHEYSYEFRSSSQTTGLYDGFDVVVYSISKAEELSHTNEFPKKKDSSSNDPKCETIDGHLLETGDYSAEEIYIPSTDRCYESALFFSVTKGDYIYNITPHLKEGFELTGDPMKEISDSIPEFFAAISTFENTDIIRPTAQQIARSRSPKPVTYKRDSLGRMVCEKDNDKPRKSKQNKGMHLDMECCLDPDEYPNPHCYYDPAKYGKYL
jgi:hypothetical protein